MGACKRQLLSMNALTNYVAIVEFLFFDKYYVIQNISNSIEVPVLLKDSNKCVAFVIFRLIM